MNLLSRRRHRVLSVLVLALFAVMALSALVLPPSASAQDAARDVRRAQIGDVSFRYRVAGSQGPVVLLLHGYPESSYAWRRVMPLLARDHRVVAPDLPGIAGSTKPSSYRYTKIAGYLEQLMRRLGHRRFAVAGHDIGGQAAYALAAGRPDVVSHYINIDVPLPGLTIWEAVKPQAWWFSFNAVPQLPEQLVNDDVRAYLTWFYRNQAFSRSSFSRTFTPTVIRRYVRDYQPSTLSGGFGYYRAFPADERDFRQLARRPLDMPVLSVGGERSLGANASAVLAGVATNVTTLVIAGAGHWVAEEQPARLASAIRSFVATSGRAAE